VTAFIDLHVHPPVPALLDGPLQPYVPGLEAVTGSAVKRMTSDEVVEFYRERTARAVLVGWDLETAGNRRPFSSADVAGIVATAPDVVAGWGAVDPGKGALAVAQVHEAARLGMKGIAVHPAAQGTGPANRLASSVWEAAADYGLVCLIHTGTTRLGYGSPGGAGVRLAAGNPMHVDAIAARLPHLEVVLAHTGPLWQQEAIAVAAHKSNVYLCPSGATPLSWPDLGEVAATTLAGRILFGSGFPIGDPDDLVASWRSSGLQNDVVERVLVGNAEALLT
jgi:predicted TIM-barrel fold metal-dependent hydrolase